MPDAIDNTIANDSQAEVMKEPFNAPGNDHSDIPKDRPSDVDGETCAKQARPEHVPELSNDTHFVALVIACVMTFIVMFADLKSYRNALLHPEYYILPVQVIGTLTYVKYRKSIWTLCKRHGRRALWILLALCVFIGPCVLVFRLWRQNVQLATAIHGIGAQNAQITSEKQLIGIQDAHLHADIQRIAVLDTINAEPILVGANDAKVSGFYNSDAQIADYWSHLSNPKSDKYYWNGSRRIIERYAKIASTDPGIMSMHCEIKVSKIADSPSGTWALVSGWTYHFMPETGKTHKWEKSTQEAWLLQWDGSIWKVARFYYDVPPHRLNLLLSQWRALADMS